MQGIRVLSQSSVTDSLKITGNRAIQNGHYQQSDLLNGKDSVSVKGNYTAHWLWERKNGWRLESMETVPIH